MDWIIYWIIFNLRASFVKRMKRLAVKLVDSNGLYLETGSLRS